MSGTFKIAVTGPESTGKSELSLALHAALQTSVYVPEYARSYLEKHGSAYTYETLDTIAAGQWQSIQDALAASPRILISDTDMTVMKVWSEFCFGRCSPFINNLYAGQEFDLYLLCDADLPWSYDPLREHPEKRAELLQWYKKALESMQRPYVLISGYAEQRLQNALGAIHKAMRL